MNRKLTRLEKSTLIVENALATKWCYVNTENEFNFINQKFVIDQSVEQYKVHNKSGTVEDFTNEAYMEQILVVVNTDGIAYYDQNYDLVENNKIQVRE